jgi:Ser/Thr protein kinase RdoA (MazF antagonist)
MLAWREDPADPDRPALDNLAVRRLAAEIAPSSDATDLGGVMSLNVGLQPAGLVLRVHQPFLSRARLLAVQEVRRRLAGQGLAVPVPLPWRGATVFRCGSRWAELEAYLPNERLAPTWEAYAWLFRALGELDRALAGLDLPVPRPVYATFGPPSTLRRWLPLTEAAVQNDPEATGIVRHLRALVRRLRARWVPAPALPGQLVHGDGRLSNVRQSPDGGTVYLDFGFLARRPRVHELAYALAWMVHALDGHRTPERFDWGRVPRLVEEYERAAGTRLTAAERAALAPYAAAVPLFQAAVAGFRDDAAQTLRDDLRRPFLGLSEWLLAHPEALLGRTRGRSPRRRAPDAFRSAAGRPARGCAPAPGSRTRGPDSPSAPRPTAGPP